MSSIDELWTVEMLMPGKAWRRIFCGKSKREANAVIRDVRKLHPDAKYRRRKFVPAKEQEP